MTIQEVVAALELEVAAERSIAARSPGQRLGPVELCHGRRLGRQRVGDAASAPQCGGVADLLGLSGVIITENARPDEETSGAPTKRTCAPADAKGSFAVVAHLAQMGIQGAE